MLIGMKPTMDVSEAFPKHPNGQSGGVKLVELQQN